MIATLTLNPSIDYVMEFPTVLPGETNRSLGEQIYPGGKGINVSIMLRRLGVESRCIAVKAGETGELLEKLLRDQGLSPKMIPQEGAGFTRINVKLLGKEITELNARGPLLTPDAMERVCRELNSLEQRDVLVTAGRFPEGEAAEALFSCLSRLKERGVKLAVDCSGPALRRLMELGPFLAKPNLREFQELTGISLADWSGISAGASRFWRQGTGGAFGAEHILLSMGGDGGALFWDRDHILYAEAPDGQAVNTVGAGDSMLAGCLAAFLNGDGPEEILRLAVACGSAAAFSPWIPDGPLSSEGIVPEYR